HSTPLVSTVPGAPTAPLFPYTTLFRSKPAVKARFDEKGRSELHALRLVVFLPVLKKVIGSGVAGGGGVFETGSASEAPSAHLWADRKSTRLNSSHVKSSYAVFCLKKKK